jgi:hypothetical protein
MAARVQLERAERELAAAVEARRHAEERLQRPAPAPQPATVPPEPQPQPQRRPRGAIPALRHLVRR